MQNFFQMGEYGSFIWSAYGIAAVVMAVLFVTSWRRLRARETELADLLESFEEPGPARLADVPANDSRDDHDGPLL